MKALSHALRHKSLNIASLRSHYSEELCEILKKLLAKRREERLPLERLIAQLTEAPKHPASWGLSAAAQAALDAANLPSPLLPSAEVGATTVGDARAVRRASKHSSGSSTPPISITPTLSDADEEDALSLASKPAGLEAHAAAGILQKSFRDSLSRLRTGAAQGRTVNIRVPGQEPPATQQLPSSQPPSQPPSHRRSSRGGIDAASPLGTPPRYGSRSPPTAAARRTSAERLSGVGWPERRSSRESREALQLPELPSHLPPPPFTHANGAALAAEPSLAPSPPHSMRQSSAASAPALISSSAASSASFTGGKRTVLKPTRVGGPATAPTKVLLTVVPTRTPAGRATSPAPSPWPSARTSNPSGGRANKAPSAAPSAAPRKIGLKPSRVRDGLS